MTSARVKVCIPQIGPNHGALSPDDMAARGLNRSARKREGIRALVLWGLRNDPLAHVALVAGFAFLAFLWSVTP